ncbi:hypothetical protein ABEF95_008976 [Exophiala dermatitidis]
MAAAKPPQYDPVKTVEGMFNGSVTRIAYAIKDPANYAQSTKAVLAETAKKFQDALDDCEIQILEAKWYLEHQLAVNKARREEKARQDSAAAHAKRKREETTDEQDKPLEKKEGGDNANAQKRVKTADAEAPTSTQTQQASKSPLQPQSAAPPGGAEQPASKAEKKPANLSQKEKPPKSNNKQPLESTTATTASQPSTGTGPPSKPSHNRPQSIQIPPNTMAQTTTTTTDELPKDTPQDNTSAVGNDDFNFVSMFGEPSGGDNMDGNGNELNFDLNGLDGTNNMNVQDASLNSLLPGLESYANQAGNDSSFNMGGNGNGSGTVNLNQGSGAGTDGGAATANNNQQQQQINISDFSLPALGPNEFDDLLNSNDMNFDEAVNLNDDGTMNMESMDLDFDSMFN